MKVFEQKLTTAGTCVMFVVLVGVLTLLRPHIPFQGSLARILASAAIGAAGALAGSFLAIVLGLTMPTTNSENEESN